MGERVHNLADYNSTYLVLVTAICSCESKFYLRSNFRKTRDRHVLVSQKLFSAFVSF